MPHDENSAVKKAVALILVGAWTILTLLLSLEGIATVTPPYYGVFTAVVFLIIGRLWNIEVDRLLPDGGS